ncbi:hypothetical protein [Corallococcus macrosporus]|uniref:Lipoprotein n=1 Tax=Myxococcus fulvus (strain ATCC BAA-855 / HW-1) TaxID=483219 RepID=F8CM23_MYXFH|nr:hypothetical protein [Corallococcus macrosporus]AEI62791.1 hypothetical protein LILAB_04350 [Corallococcus macrosporus]
MSHLPRLRASLLAGCCAALGLLGACTHANASAPPATSLSVRELNIVDEHGQARIRIAAPMPDPQGLKRATRAYGIQFLSPSGQELGGLAMLDSIGIRGLCFDSEEGYEAMCMGLIQGKPNITFRHDWKERIVIGVEEGVASVTLHDARGTPHLKLAVDKDGATRVEGVTPATAGR